jgi:hypothetical protein
MVAAAHPVVLRGAALGSAATARQLILERADEDFIPAIFDELTRANTNDARDLLKTIASTKTANGILKLYQPVQRVFNVALFEMLCDVPGHPRFDPTRIESAGMVIRRIWRDGGGTPHFDTHEGWRQDGPTLRGWVKFDTPAEFNVDPDPVQRPVQRIGHPEADRRLALLRGEKERLSETFTPLFPAPPEVCTALGKTILFGVIPVASAEQSEAPAPVSYTTADVNAVLSPMLTAGGTSLNLVVPRPNAWVVPKTADEDDMAPWVNLLRQLVVELDAFGESRESKALFAALERIHVPMEREYRRHDQPTRTAGELLRQHAAVLVNREHAPTRRPGVAWPGYPEVQMPSEWPTLSGAVARDIATAAKAVLEARIAAVIKPRTPRYDQRKRTTKQVRPGRYDETGPMYRLRAFARVRHHDDCPPHLVWSATSDAFAIAPWYEGGGAPPVQVALPDPSDQDFLKALKPNVAFAVPGSLFDMINKNQPKKLFDAKGSAGGAVELDWICGFNIPIITICAFIVLTIVLSILDYIFHWIPFVRICLPIPKKP